MAKPKRQEQDETVPFDDEPLAGEIVADGDEEAPRNDLLKAARKKLARMEETNKLCYKHRADYAKLEEELAQFGYSDNDLDYILRPKGAKNIPGFAYAEIESQRQYVKRLENRVERSGSRVDEIDGEERRGPAR